MHRFSSDMNTHVPACLIPNLVRTTCISISSFGLKTSSRDEHLAIVLMPLLARRVRRKYILHIMIALVSSTYNPYSFCLVEVRHCHILNLVSLRNPPGKHMQSG